MNASELKKGDKIEVLNHMSQEWEVKEISKATKLTIWFKNMGFCGIRKTTVERGIFYRMIKNEPPIKYLELTADFEIIEITEQEYHTRRIIRADYYGLNAIVLIKKDAEDKVVSLMLLPLECVRILSPTK